MVKSSLVFAYILLCFASCVHAEQTYIGKVVSVSDGDTISVSRYPEPLLKVRLAGIDAPEKQQAFGQRAKESLSKLVAWQKVRVVEVGTDRYGRVIGDVYVQGLWVNLEMVSQGVAWVYRHYSHDPRLLEAEERAKSSRSGLWVEPMPVPPWEWRKSQRKPKKH